MNSFDIFLTILFLGLCYLTLAKASFFRSSNIPIRQLILFFSLQVLCSALLYFIYTKIYTERRTADIFKFYDDAEILFNHVFVKSPLDYIKLIMGFESSEITRIALDQTSFWKKPFEPYLYNDNQTVIRINMIIRLFSFGSYGVHALFFTFVSFTGLTAIYKSFMRFFDDKRFLLKTACFLIPSVLLWSSGILKESILFFALGILILQVSKVLEEHRMDLKKIVMIALCMLLLVITKTYVLLMLAPGLLGLILWETGVVKKGLFAFVLSSTVVLGPILMLGNFVPSMDLPHILYKMQEDFINVAHITHASSFFQINKLDESIWSLVLNIPEALFNVLLRPLPLYTASILNIVASLENMLILVIFVYTLTHRCAIKLQMKGLWLLLFGFSFYMFVLIGLTVPVEGAIVRYKAPVLPLFLILLFAGSETKKLIELKTKILPTWIVKLLS